MIQTQALSFKYKKGQEDFSFPDIALNVNDNLLILGKSGIGKTTLLHLLAGLLEPTSGKVIINNVDINELSSGKLDKFRGKHIGLVFQKKYAIPSLSVYENIKARLFFSKHEVDESQIDALLNDLGLSEYKNSKPNELSEGQLQRLNIAMAVVHQPKIILADEPTSSLDDENCNAVMELLQKQAKRTNAILIVITHDSRIKENFQNTIAL
ncbi:ABC transporter ATP-binding protein [Seonamhaeicola sp. ML3]|uniref:ABC transporter ATP-binding protein n=1 Tax=Seonamhaeicola sp. ML3 TaxID=2937786 RepID=UPI00200D1594|nr:ATP-binding cassette domain-containing protein [Seonamhaeicola sp. ML3]